MVEGRMNKIVIADDHPLLLQGLYDLLIGREELEIVGKAEDGAEALRLILDQHPQVAILDIEMPYLSGLAIAEECRKKYIETRFIILSYHKEPEVITQAKALNIAGYVLKEDTSAEIFNCLDEVIAGGLYFSPSILSDKPSTVEGHFEKLRALTPSERKILKLIAERTSSQEIAERLHISERTVEKHRSNIIGKLELSGQPNELLLWSLEHKELIISL